MSKYLHLELPLSDAVAQFERSYMQMQLCRTGFNVTLAAKNSGYDRAAFTRKAKRLGVAKNAQRND